MRLEIGVGHVAERRDIGFGGDRGLGIAPVADRIDPLEDHRPEFSVLDARLFERRFRIGAERRFALPAAAPVAVGPIGAALAQRLEEQALPVGVSVGFLDQALEALWI